MTFTKKDIGQTRRRFPSSGRKLTKIKRNHCNEGAHTRKWEEKLSENIFKYFFHFVIMFFMSCFFLSSFLHNYFAFYIISWKCFSVCHVLHVVYQNKTDERILKLPTYIISFYRSLLSSLEILLHFLPGTDFLHKIKLCIQFLGEWLKEIRPTQAYRLKDWFWK